MIAKKQRTDRLLSVLLWVLSLLIIIPLAMIVLNSFKDVTESAVMTLKAPTTWHPENYIEVLKDEKLVASFFNSIILCVGSGGITIVVSALAAFVLSRNRSRLNRFIYIVFLLGLVAPINYITTVKVLQALNLINTMPGAILLYTAQYIPFTIFIYYGFIGTVPRSLDEAAIIDGCGSIRLFFKIIFPLLK